MSTPPSEMADEQTGEQTMDITDLSQLDLTQSQFYNKLYERYHNDPKYSDRQAWANRSDPDQSGQEPPGQPCISLGCITL